MIKNCIIKQVNDFLDLKSKGKIRIQTQYIRFYKYTTIHIDSIVNFFTLLLDIPSSLV